ncbi:MAG: efflux RND transporter periplasmic adaptor subunit, partial [Rheinheimera sp.]
MSVWQKAALALSTLALGVLVFGIIQATGQDKVKQDASLAVAPLVQITALKPQHYQFELSVWAEVIPQEQTRLTPEVSGRVIAMHPEFIDGGLIKKGDVMVQLDDADYQAQLLSAEAAVATAKATLEQELALAKVAKEENRNVSPQLLTSLALRKPQLQSAEAGLKSATAMLQKAQRDLARTRIVAPYDALVVLRHIGLGQVVSSGTVLAELNNIEFAEIRLPVASFDLPFLPTELKGIPAVIHVEGQSRLGTVVSDLGVLQPKTRMHHLVVQVADPYALRQNA